MHICAISQQAFACKPSPPFLYDSKLSLSLSRLFIFSVCLSALCVSWTSVCSTLEQLCIL